jgi:hypothetical protein
MAMAKEPVRHTIREQIMQNLKVVFETDTDPSRVTWDFVTRAPITSEATHRHSYMLGLYDVSERIREAAMVEYRNLNVVCEFHVQLAEGDEPSTFLNHCLGSIANRIGEDITVGGLALNTRENGSELDIDGAFDKYVSGIIIFDVSYRCRSNDPYTRA